MNDSRVFLVGNKKSGIFQKLLRFFLIKEINISGFIYQNDLEIQ